MEHWWSDTVKRKVKYLEENLSEFQFVHNKSHVDWLGIEPRDLHKESDDYLP
jgi:hypothetical protein